MLVAVALTSGLGGSSCSSAPDDEPACAGECKLLVGGGSPGRMLPEGFCTRATEICSAPLFNERVSSPDEIEGVLEPANADTEANARCALEALRDGRVGRFEVHVLRDGGRSFFAAIHIASGRIVSMEKAFGGFGRLADRIYQAFANTPLKDASFFEACLATDDVNAFGACLEKPTEDQCP